MQAGAITPLAQDVGRACRTSADAYAKRHVRVFGNG